MLNSLIQKYSPFSGSVPPENLANTPPEKNAVVSDISQDKGVKHAGIYRKTGFEARPAFNTPRAPRKSIVFTAKSAWPKAGTPSTDGEKRALQGVVALIEKYAPALLEDTSLKKAHANNEGLTEVDPLLDPGFRVIIQSCQGCSMI